VVGADIVWNILHFLRGRCPQKDGKTLLVLRELYPSKQALDDAIASGSSGTSGAPEQFELLDELLVTLVRS